MEPLPKGANFIRAKFLWEIGLHIAGNPATPYYGNRDICITIGSGSGDTYKPWLRMSCGSPILAHAVARGELEAAIVNPSAMLTQAVRGKGLFKQPLPLCISAFRFASRRARTPRIRRAISSTRRLAFMGFPCATSKAGVERCS